MRERLNIAVSPLVLILCRSVSLENPILLIEENESDARVLSENLARLGLGNAVDRVTCPSDARMRLESATLASGRVVGLPSAVIIGLGMEARVGFDFVRWLRRHPELSKMVVIALGERGHLREVQEAYSSGANAYFVKGPDCAALIRTLQSAFKKDATQPSERGDTHPAFRNSTDLYAAQLRTENGGMANRAPLLLVDDDDAHTKQFIQSLERLRVRNPLRRVSGADEAIEYLGAAGKYADRNAHPFPIVLFLDIRLTDSHKLLAWMEGHPALRPAGIIALTSSHDMRPVIQAYHLGVHSFLKEPPKLEELRNALTAAPNTELVQDETGNVIRLRTKTP
jgi:two-component system response regulator